MTNERTPADAATGAPPATDAAQHGLDPSALARLSPEQQRLFEDVSARLRDSAHSMSQEKNEQLALAAVFGNSDPENSRRLSVDRIVVWNHLDEGVKVSLLNKVGEQNTFGISDAPPVEQSLGNLERLRSNEQRQADNVVDIADHQRNPNQIGPRSV